MNVNVLYSHSTLRHERHTHIGGSTVSYWYIICWYFVSMLMHIFTPNMSVWGCSLWRDTGARTHSAFQCWWYICVNQHVHVFRPHPRISCPSSQLVHPVSTFYTCVPPPTPPPPPRPRGPAQCWRRRCPGVSRPRWGWAPPGHDTTPTHTSSSWPSPVEEGEKSRGSATEGQCGEGGWFSQT